MKEDLVEVVAILDISGSMKPIAADTINGFNEYLAQLTKQPENVNVSLVLFNTESKVIYEHKPASKCKRLNKQTYYPYGGTALTDALGLAVTNMQTYIQSLPEELKPGKVSFFVSTDGTENSSSVFTIEQVQKLVQKSTEDDKFEFIFIGANIDSFEMGRKLGFHEDNIANIENDGIAQKAMFEAVAEWQMNKPKSKRNRSAEECEVNEKCDIPQSLNMQQMYSNNVMLKRK
ncbi:von_Willebrand factor type A domain-containing protein [Hexamita inflata]|uniref:von Willebrand factor type A domain-containing protein n=1 Tax=Hexamita inflata TaxID=28002 RepID=A0AA86V8S5_9EUKA|nr:von Willebrand factor type A domain-containing protein [Hexamita inflata]